MYQFGKSGVASKASAVEHLLPPETKAMMGRYTYSQYANWERFTMVDSKIEKLLLVHNDLG